MSILKIVDAPTRTLIGDELLPVSVENTPYKVSVNDIATFTEESLSGASGTFTTTDNKTVTVTNGLITSIV